MPKRGKGNVQGKADSRRMQRSRSTETEEECKMRKETVAERKRQRTLSESPEQRENRLKKGREYMSKKTLHETDEEKQARLLSRKVQHSRQVAEESAEQRRMRLTSINVSRSQLLKRTRNNALAHIVDESDPIYDELFVGDMNIVCPECEAKHFAKELPSDGKFSSCCHKGKVKLNALLPYPKLLFLLVTKQHELSAVFMDNIRAYNSSIAFASFGAKLSLPVGTGPYCFRIHGQIYHRTSSSAVPIGGEKPKFSQYYVLDSTEMMNEKQELMMRQKLNEQLEILIDAEIRRINPFAEAYKMLAEVERTTNESSANNEHNVIMSICRQTNLDPRRYNRPNSNEVAIIFENENGEPPINRDIRVYFRSESKPQQISILNPNLIYPCLMLSALMISFLKMIIPSKICNRGIEY
jgi:hypothetical protein